MNLQNKIALITGASKGIGAATARTLAQAGCTVIINYKSDAKAAKKILEQCNHLSKGHLMIRADVSKEAEVKKMMDIVNKHFKHLDILVNNAGTFDESDNLANVSVFEKLFRINFLSAIIVTKYSLKLMRQGKIINVSSIHGRLGYGRPTAAAYAAFKAALENYTKNLAKQLAPRILVNAVAPGRVLTPIWDNPSQKQQKHLGQAHLIKRMIKPEEIADAILFLVQNDAVCAEVLTIDGGYRLSTID
jgi:3-oxoacyl-[acyl-carrier protein] reductase